MYVQKVWVPIPFQERGPDPNENDIFWSGPVIRDGKVKDWTVMHPRTWGKNNELLNRMPCWLEEQELLVMQPMRAPQEFMKIFNDAAIKLIEAGLLDKK
jgi:hypothetical protein